MTEVVHKRLTIFVSWKLLFALVESLFRLFPSSCVWLSVATEHVRLVFGEDRSYGMCIDFNEFILVCNLILFSLFLHYWLSETWSYLDYRSVVNVIGDFSFFKVALMEAMHHFIQRLRISANSTWPQCPWATGHMLRQMHVYCTRKHWLTSMLVLAFRGSVDLRRSEIKRNGRECR